MGGEWSKAVGMIFKQKYSAGRGKLQDAMKDPDTKVLHEQLKSGKKVKVGKTRKMRGGAGAGAGAEGEAKARAEAEGEARPEGEGEAGDEGEPPEGNNSKSLEEKVADIEERLAALESANQRGGFPAKSKKSRKVKSRRN